jgi:hypothetical protein
MGDDDTFTYTISTPSIEDGNIDGLTVGGTISPADCSYTAPASTYTIDTASIDPSFTFSDYNNFDSDITVSDNADIKIGEKSLKEFMNKVEDRLAILQPDPNKLEKFEALRKAYEHYKTVEALCVEDADDDEEKTIY